MNYKQKIQITGKSIDDIFKLPCILSANKRSGKEEQVAYFVLDPSQMADPDKWQFAHIGDWLCEDDNGYWHVETNDKL